MKTMRSRNASDACECGELLPVHLAIIANDRFSHVCSCERSYVVKEGKFVAKGRARNPFAEHDRAKNVAVPVLFLDFDGVLNSAEFFKRFEGSGEQKIVALTRNEMLDAAAIARLNTIVERTGAAVVVSSSWRIPYGVGQLAEFLRNAGFRGQVVGATAVHGDGNRGVEIAAWLGAQKHRAPYAILDDSTIVGHGSRFVQTSWGKGLLDEHVDAVVELLGRP